MTFRKLERPGEPAIAYRVESPSSGSLGRVLMIHGYAEHSARYDRTVRLWLESGLTVARFDLRGHGRSEGTRGHVQRFAQYVGDVSALLHRLDGEPAWQGSQRTVLFGHSLGGLIATHAALSLGDAACGLALTSPFFGLALPVSAPTRLLARVAGRLAPGLRQASGLKGEELTHDAVLARGYDADPLGFQHVTAGWFAEVQRAQKELPEMAPRLRLPLLLMAAGDDRVASTDAARRIFGLVGSAEKELDVAPGLFHELLNEPEWLSVATRLSDRMLRWAST